MTKAYFISSKPQSLFSTTIKDYIHTLQIFSAIEEHTCQSTTDAGLLNLMSDNDYIFLLDVDDNYADIVLQIRVVCQAKIVVVLKNTILDSHKIKVVLEHHSVGVINLNSHISSVKECIDVLTTKDYYMCDYTKDWVINNIIEGKSETSFKNFNSNELTILELAKKGYNIDMTAAEMDLSRNTIAAYRSKMLRKANAKSFSELVYLSSKEPNVKVF